jgi:hypothetical protein
LEEEMSEKLDKLRASLEKERERRIKINTRIESLERRIQEAEAAEVNEMVRTAKVTLEKLASLAGAKEKCDAPECSPVGCRKVRDAHEL